MTDRSRKKGISPWSVPVYCLYTDDVAMVVFGVKVSVGENVLSDMVTASQS